MNRIRAVLIRLLAVAVGLGCGFVGYRVLFGDRRASVAATQEQAFTGGTPAPLGTNGVPTPPPFSPTVFEPMSIRSQAARIPVIMYHDVVKERGAGSVFFDCTVDELKAHLKYIEENGIKPISLEELHRHLVRGEPAPEKAVVLTFDDNYQGFYDNAYPLLKAKGYPSAMFVHTNFVGSTSGSHPKMSWDTLREMDKEGLVTIGSHTLSHPDDLTALSEEKQSEELEQAKKVLEEHLGHPIPYFCYPVGKNNATTREIAERAGYTMAFTMENGPVEESPSILQLNRYVQTRFERAFEEADEAKEKGPAAIVDVELKASPVRLEVAKHAGIEIGMVRGGMPKTWRSGRRQSVGEFIRDGGGVAGVNGSFFADSRLVGTDATMIGPCMTANDPEFKPDMAPDRLPRLLNRPVIIVGPKRIIIAPFQPGFMNQEAPYRALMPDVTDIFLGGAWIVHDGVPRTEEQLDAYAARDFRDTRRRAFFGLTKDGEIIAGGTLEVVSTQKMAEAAAAAGAQEAVLLDSGFSTSVVFDNKIIVTGHTAEHIPSRAVPHAIVLSGTLEMPSDPVLTKLLAEANAAIDPEGGAAIDTATEEPKPRRRRRRRRAPTSQAASQSASQATSQATSQAAPTGSGAVDATHTTP